VPGTIGTPGIATAVAIPVPGGVFPGAHRTPGVLQTLLGLFVVVVSALPTFSGDPYAVAVVDEIGTGQWFRHLIGGFEPAGGIGLPTGRFTGPAAVGPVLLTVGAAPTRAFVLHGDPLVVTPVVLGVLAAVIAQRAPGDLAHPALTTVYLPDGPGILVTAPAPHVRRHRDPRASRTGRTPPWPTAM